MRRRTAGNDPARLRQIDKDEVESHLRAAGGAPHPAVRIHHLESAARLATQRGLVEEAKQIAAEMQTISMDDLGMQVFTSESEIPTWVPESFVSRFTRSPRWQDGMSIFITSDVDDRRQHHNNSLPRCIRRLAELLPSGNLCAKMSPEFTLIAQPAPGRQT